MVALQLYLIKTTIAAIMRFLLQNSIMTATSPPDLLNVATVMALHVQTVSAEITHQADFIQTFTLNFLHIKIR